MLKKRIVTVFGALLAAVMLVLVAVPADATRYTRAEKREFKHWLRSENHDWRRWMHEQKYHWWKWVHEQKQLFYKGEWDRNAKFVPPGSDSGNSDNGNPGGTTDPGNTGGGEPPATEPKPRFEVLTEVYNGLAVRDNETGLIWEKNPNTGKLNFYAAWMHCARKDLNGQMGWRMPATADFTSLMDGVNSDAAGDLLLPAGHHFGGIFTAPGVGYWSATQGRNMITGGNRTPLAVYFGLSAANGSLANTVGQVPYGNLAGVWCVRGGFRGPSVTD